MKKFIAKIKRWSVYSVVKGIVFICWLLSKTFFFPKFWLQFIASAKIGRASQLFSHKKYEEAAQLYHEIIELNSAEYINEIVFEQLGEMYEKGLGVQKDEIKAEEYYLRAGTRGNSHKLHEFAIKGYTDKFKV